MANFLTPDASFKEVTLKVLPVTSKLMMSWRLSSASISKEGLSPLTNNTSKLSPTSIFSKLFISLMATVTIFEPLNSIVKKIEEHSDFETFSDLVYPQGIYRFSNKLFSDYPNAEKLQGKGTKNKIVSKSLIQLDFVFKNKEEKGGNASWRSHLM